jgi:hypothetical protein
LEKTQKTVGSSQLYVDPTTKGPTKLAQHLDKIPEYKQRLGLNSEDSDEEMYKAMKTLCARFESINEQIKGGWREKALQSNQSATGAPLLTNTPEDENPIEALKTKMTVNVEQGHKATLRTEVQELMTRKKADEKTIFSQMSKWTRETLSMNEDPVHLQKLNYIEKAFAFINDPSSQTVSDLKEARMQYDNAKDAEGILASTYKGFKEVVGLSNEAVDKLTIQMQEYTDEFDKIPEKYKRKAGDQESRNSSIIS